MMMAEKGELQMYPSMEARIAYGRSIRERATCLLEAYGEFERVGANGGEIGGKRIFQPVTIERAIREVSKMEMDRFCEAMIQIRKEIAMVESGKWAADNNPLCNAPHTAEDMISDWQRPYTRAQAFYPLPWVKEKKFWVASNRVDNVYGDKNIMCSCPPLSDYEAPATRELQL